MANEIMETETQSLANFIHAATAGTNIAIRESEAQRLAISVKQQSDQFQAVEERTEKTAVMQALLEMMGMKEARTRAGIMAGSREKEPPYSAYIRGVGFNERVNQGINEIESLPQSNERFGAEIISLSKEVENYDFRNPNSRAWLDDRMNDIARKYEVSSLGTIEHEVLQDKLIGGSRGITKEIRYWTKIIAPENPQAIKTLNGKFFNKSSLNPIYIDEDVPLVSSKATIRNLMNEIFNTIIKDPDTIMKVTGYDNIDKLIEDFSNQWANPATRKGVVVDNVLKLLNTHGIMMDVGGAVTPEQMANLEKVGRKADNIGVMAGLAEKHPEDFPDFRRLSVPVKGDTVNSIWERQQQRTNRVTEASPSEYTAGEAETLLAGWIPNFTEEKRHSNQQKSLIDDFLLVRMQKLLNEKDEDAKYSILKGIMEELETKIATDDDQYPISPYIRENDYGIFYNEIVKKAKIKLSTDDEDNLGLGR